MQSSPEFRRRVADMPLTGEDTPHLSRWLQPKRILLDVEVDDMASLFEVAAREIGQMHGLASGPVHRALARREQVGSTALGDRFAIPHARIAGIEEPLTLLIRLAKGIDFRAPDESAVELFLFIMVPLGDHHAHLQLLAAVAKLFSDRQIRSTLDAAASPDAMAEALTAGIARISR
jgi:PTS system nitrogen regulatory IIA component